MTLSRADLLSLAAAIEKNPQAEIAVDVQNRTVTCAGTTYAAGLPHSAHEALLSGKWDAIARRVEHVALNEDAGFHDIYAAEMRLSAV